MAPLPRIDHTIGGPSMEAHENPRDAGFTLVELLVVMIIVGVLAAVSIPVFLSQRAKAHDVAVRSDVARVGKEITSYFVDGRSALVVDATTTPGSLVLRASGAESYEEEVRLSAGTHLAPGGATAGLGESTGWCIALTHDGGSTKTYRYTAVAGLQPGTC